MRKKVLIITKHLRIGGTEKMLLRILPIWRSLGWDIDILLLYNDVTLLDDELNNYHIFSIFPQKSEKAKQEMREYPDLIYQKYIGKEYDVEIAFQEGFPTKLISNSPNSRSIKIAWVHSIFEEYHFSSTAYQNNEEESQVYEAFNKIIFCSYAAQYSFNRVLKIRTPKQEVIYPPTIQGKLPDQSNEYLPSVQPPFFLVLSRLSPQKGLDRLLLAADLLARQKMHFTILIIGSGELEEDIRHMLEEYHLEQYVVLLPATSNPFPFLKICDACISPSYTESFGLAMQEALCLKKPVIACETTGSKEVLMNGKFGAIVKPSANALSEAMKACLVNTSYVEQLHQKAQAGCTFWKKQATVSREQILSLSTKF